MKDKIKTLSKAMGLTQFGVCELPGGKQALVFLFPYYINEPSSPISLYARGTDYHITVKDYLYKICSFLKDETGNDFSENIYCDISPYNDKEIAYSAGLGFYGKNTLLINPTFGSYFFIGYIITHSLNLENDSPLNISCSGCNACINACPGNALKDDSVHLEHCASNISQKKGELSPREQSIMLKSGYFWGCDCCQKVCPHNANLPDTALPEFTQNRLNTLSSHDLSVLSEKQFREKYKTKAFTWRGKTTLLRNIRLFNK